jgi:hypothetical protein
MLTLILLVLTWGVLAFGAVYPWAYRPLLAVSALVGLLGLVRGARASRRIRPRPIEWSLALVVFAILIQLLPLPLDLLDRLSPAAADFAREYDLGLQAILVESGESGGSPRFRPAVRHPLSIWPARTALGLAFVSAFGIWTIGLTRELARQQMRRLASAIVALALVVALVGIIQRAGFSGALYGFWVPTQNGFAPFGPFVNRNHFAGWMVMALGVALGHLAGIVGVGLPEPSWGWRRRLLRLASTDASRLLLIGGATTVMALSLMLTLSRSGILSISLAVTLTGWWVARRRPAGARRRLLAACVTVPMVAALFWAGPVVVASRFWEGLDARGPGRLAAWSDTVRIIRDFPLAGSGLNTYGTAMLVYQTRSADDLHFREAHNDYLQLIAEGGLLVGVPLLLAGLALAREIRARFEVRRDDEVTYWIRVGAVTGLVAIAIQETVDFSLQMPGNAVLFGVLAAIAAHDPMKQVRRPARFFAGRTAAAAAHRMGRPS